MPSQLLPLWGPLWTLVWTDYSQTSFEKKGKTFLLHSCTYVYPKRIKTNFILLVITQTGDHLECFLSLFFFFLFCFLGLHQWHTEVPRLGSNQSYSCWPTPQVQQCRIQGTFAIYTRAQGSARSLTHWARPGIKLESSWILVGFVNLWATTGTPLPLFLYYKITIPILSWKLSVRHDCIQFIEKETKWLRTHHYFKKYKLKQY